MTPRLTVVMTAYNRERLIAESIASVLAQSFDDFELLVVDDASTDGTARVACDFARRDPRVRLVRNEHNKGDFPNRNHAVGFVNTPLFKFHDSDDVMYPHCLEVMVSSLDAVPEADFALSGSRNWPGGPSPMLLTPALAYEREFLGTGLFQLGPACALFKTDFFRSLGGFEAAGVASDYLFWFKACRRGRVLLCPGDLFYYRLHPGQELTSERSVRDYTIARGRAWAALNDPDCPLHGEALEQAKRNFAFNAVREAWRMCVGRRDYRSARELLQCAGLRPRDWARYLRRPRRSFDAGTPR